jgi:MFS transporter, DHA2 family, multidrug resistance protein
MAKDASTSNAVDGAKATRREWIGLAVIALPCMLYSMDLTVLNLAVPHLTMALIRPARSSCGSSISMVSCSPEC